MRRRGGNRVKSTDWSFPRQVLVALSAVVAVAVYPLAKYGSAETTSAAILGALLTTANVLLGYAAIQYSFRKSTIVFFKFVLGGMAVRMMLLTFMLVLLIKVWNVEIAPLVWSMALFYIVYLTLEVLYIQRKLGNRQEP